MPLCAPRSRGSFFALHELAWATRRAHIVQITRYVLYVVVFSEARVTTVHTPSAAPTQCGPLSTAVVPGPYAVGAVWSPPCLQSAPAHALAVYDYT